MFIFNIFAFFLFLTSPTDLRDNPQPCYVYSQALGDRFGIHDDPSVPPPCPYVVPE